MPRTKEQYENIRQNRKEQILTAALELFSTEGYGHVSIASLAKHANISKGLMYNYFASKEQLLEAVIDNVINEILDAFDLNHDGILTPGEFELFIKKTFQILREKREFFTKFFRLILQPKVTDFIHRGSFMNFIEHYLSILESYFKKQGFEDPMLEIFNLSVLIEGMGIMLSFYSKFMEFPEELLINFEKRIIETYT